MGEFIALQWPSFFRKKLVYSTNFPNLEPLVFEQKNLQLVVKGSSQIKVTTDGLSFLHINEREYISRRIKEFGARFVSKDDWIAFGLLLSPQSRGGDRSISCSRNAEEKYTFFDDSWESRIEACGSVADPNLMIGLLAYFWLERKKDREWS